LLGNFTYLKALHYASGMSDAVFDRGLYFPSPMTDWYRGRPFKVALVGSLLIHAALIALIPGFRAVVIEPPKVLNVEIVLPEQPLVRPMTLREVVPPAAPHGQSPNLGTLHPSLVRALEAAYRAAAM